MSAFTTPPRQSSSRVSSRKTSPQPLHIPAPSIPLPQHVFSPRHRSRGGRHISRSDPGHCGLYPLVETAEDDLAEDSRCPSWYSNDPSSPGASESVDRSSLVYTPYGDEEDPFENYTLSPMSDSFHPSDFDMMATPKTPSPLRHTARRTPSLELDTQHRFPRSSIRTPTAPLPRAPRVSAASTAPYPPTPMRSATAPLLPALPILAPCEQRAVPPSPPTPSTPVTPTTPSIDGMGVNLVSALRDLLTSCGEFENYRDEEMFADAEEDDRLPAPGQFDDAVSPNDPSPIATPFKPFHAVPSGIVVPRTPPPKANPALYEELIRAPRQTRGPREPLACGLDGDHSVLNAMSSEARADRLAAEAQQSLRSIPSLPSLSSSSSLSSASSVSLHSLSSYGQNSMSMTPFATDPKTPPQASSSRKPGVSSRRILRSPLPPLWTA